MCLCVCVGLQAGETCLHAAVRHCHFSVADKVLKFTSKRQSRHDLVMLVNEQNEVGPPVKLGQITEDRLAVLPASERYPRWCPLKGSIKKVKQSIAVCKQPHRYGNSRAIWDHTVLPATRQR